MSSIVEVRQRISAGLSRNDEKTSGIRRSLYERYGEIARYIYENDSTLERLLKGNHRTYCCLNNASLIAWSVLNKNKYSEYKEVCKTNKHLQSMFASFDTATSCMGKLTPIIGRNDESSLDDIIQGLQEFDQNKIIKSVEYEAEQGNGIDSDDIVIIDDEDDIYNEEEIYNKEDTEISNDEIPYGANNNSSYTIDEELKKELALLATANESNDGTEDITYDKGDIVNASKQAEKSGVIKELDSNILDEDDEDIDTSEVQGVDDISEITVAILNRNEAVFRSCLELDRPYGMLYSKGMLSYKVENGRIKYIPGQGQGTSVFERLYKAIMQGARSSLYEANDLRNVPNTCNIEGYNWNYYPGFMFKYALGVVDNQTYRVWKTFRNACEKSIENRLKKMYAKGIFFNNIAKIESSFSNAILVLSYEPGSGIKLRLSLTGVNIDINNLERSIKSVQTYRNASIAITNVSGYEDVVDIQILQNEDKFLNKPYWAYKAMQVKIDNGDRVSLSDGLPIGRKVNGEIVEYKLDPSNRFLTFIAAGSGAGKGVLTLSLVAAALGSQIPVYYMDFKPDMAPIFWDLEREYGVPSFTYDAMVTGRVNSETPARHTKGYGMPEEVRKELGKFSGAILYLKSVQLMCAMAQYRADVGASNPIMYVFDETQAMQRLIKSAVEKTVEIKKKHAPKKVKGVEEEPDSVYVYVSTLLDWFKEVNVNIDTYINTTGRKSNTFCIFIAQSPDYSTWNNLKIKTDDGQIELLSRITFADTIFKILGRGSTTSKYGLGGDGKKSVTPKELQYVANNRFFGMYDGKTTDGADIKIFKPFLTLNSDDPMADCWKNGMGKSFGAGSEPDEIYVQNIAKVHPGEGQLSNKYGIHTGTGFAGLTSMYCGGSKEKFKEALGASWIDCMNFFNTTGLNSKYENPSDYMYDTSLDGLMFIGNMVSYSQANENSVLRGINDSIEDSNTSNLEDGTLDTGWEVNGLNDESNNVALGDLDNIVNGADIINNQDEQYKQQNEDYLNEQRALEALLNSNQDAINSGGLIDEYIDENDGLNEENSEVNIESSEVNENDSYSNYDTVINQSDEIATSSIGKGGRVNTVDSSATKNVAKLDRNNCIDCRGAGPGPLRPFERMFLDTPRGAQKYIDKLWKSILDMVVQNGYRKANIKRVSMYGNQMYVNEKILNLNGVLGGYENIRLRDICSYRILFKRFFMLSHLRIDSDMLRVAIIELGDNPIEKLFNLGSHLEVIMISENGKVREVKRYQTEDNSDMVSRGRLKNDIDEYCVAEGSRKWKDMTATDSIWGMRIAKSSMSMAGKSFMNESRPRIGSAILYGGVGLVAGTVGTLAWGVSKGVGKIFSLGNSFKR